VALAAAAAATSRIRLCVGVAAIPRYRPHLLARTIASLDHLSGGRVILGAGLGGAPEEFAAYGEEPDLRLRSEKLDEGLDLLAQLLSGEPTTFEGKHFAAHGVVQAPAAMQQPRPPIWIGGESHAALRRAARWDGWIVPTIDENSAITKTPEDVAHCTELLKEMQPTGRPLDVAVSGVSWAGEHGLVREYASAGATWWFESLFGLRGSVDDLRERIRNGPHR
jgi:alkanesulfonate monooxygenase SsuD/methylene tetrahydromethanopterin reductase-like flavin-dependent oxidoreductase (luciferase family)